MRRSSLLMLALAVGGAALGIAAISPVAAEPPAIYLEDSPSAQEQVQRALSLRERGRVGEAAQRLQQVIIEHPFKLMRIEPGLYEDTLAWVRRRIIGDPELLDAYRQRYSGTADRSRQEAMASILDAGALEQVVRLYAVTEAGLEAGMDLAAMHLERADGGGAASVLDELAEHPDLEREAHRGRYHYLQALAGLLGGERSRMNRHRQRLEEEFEAEAGRFAALLERFDPPRGSLAWVRTGPPQPAAVSAEQLATPLWDGQVQWTPMGLASDRLTQRNRGRDNELVPIQPVADERRVYLNQGDSVRALDRDSGWQTWIYRWPGAKELSREAQGLRAINEPQVYERGVALGTERVYAVMGGASPWPSRWEQGDSVTALVAMDRRHGEALWSLRPEALDPALAEAYFVGTPIVSRDRLLVLLRRSQASGFMDTYLVAVSGLDGSLLWRRHIASAAVNRRFSGGPRPRMSVDDGLVFVADNYGAVVALDRRRGAVRWARVLAERASDERADEDAHPEGRREARLALNPIFRSGAASDEPGGPAPAALGAGLVVFDPTGGAPILLDARTGKAVRKLDEEPWLDVRGVVLPHSGKVTAASNDERVEALLVGKNDLTLVDGKTLETLWSHEPENNGPGSPYGQVALTHDHVLYVGDDQLLVLDRGDGEIEYRHDISSPANILPLDHQIVLVDREQVRSYMDWDRAAQRLRRRIEESPDLPEPGMALAHLALRGGHADQVLEGADAALRALGRLRDGPISDSIQARAAQKHAFDHMLNLARDEAAVDADLSEMLFDRLATITTGPEQETSYHLAAAAFYEEVGRVREAVDHWQAVLRDRTLASQLQDSGNISRQAGLEAQQRLRTVVEVHGSQVYARYERASEVELRRLLSQHPPVNAEALVALAERYPLATSASTALIAASERLAERGELAAAAQQLRRARDWAATPEIRTQVVSHTVGLYERHDQPRRAVTWLERLRREHPEAVLQRKGDPITAGQWIEQLRQLTADVGPLPALELPLGQPEVLPGRLVSLRSGSGNGERSEALLSFHESHLHSYDRDTFALQWRTPVPTDDLELIGTDEDWLLFWSAARSRVFALDKATGEPGWASEHTQRLLEGVGDESEREAERHIDQRRFMRMVEHAPRVRERQEQQRRDPDRPEVFVAVGSATIALADWHGRVAGIDRRSGRVVWRLMVPTERVLRTASYEDSLVLAGVNGAGTDAESGAMTVVDMLAGEMPLPLIEDKHEPRWVGFAGDEQVAMVGGEQVTVYSVDTGEVAWRSHFEDEQSATITDGWADKRMLVLIDEARSAQIYDAATGRTLDRVSLTQRRVPGTVRGDPLEEQWYLLTSDGLTAIDSDGEVRWRDAISDNERGKRGIRSYLLTQEHVVLLARDDQAELRGWRELERDQEVVVRGPDGELLRVRQGPVPGAEDDPQEQDEEDVEADTWLYLLERRGGALVAEHPLVRLPSRPRLEDATIEFNRLIIPLDGHVLVIPGASSE